MTPLVIQPTDTAPENARPGKYGISRGKRLVDVLISGTALALLSPLLLATAIAIKLDSPGPVLYSQDRVGVNRRRRSRRGSAPQGSPDERRRSDRRATENEGRVFSMLKFRSMRLDAEAGGPVWAKKNDPRVTRLGKFLRRTRIDEVPQLWNILKGDMSLVGPRPERPYFVKRLMERFPAYRGRLQVPPGLTGLAQIERPYDENEDDVRRKLAYDLFYIQNRHILVDLKILVRTLGVVLARKGSR